MAIVLRRPRSPLAAALLFAALFATGAVASSQTPPPPSADRAVTLARQGRWAEARAVMANVPEPAEQSRRIAFHRLNAAIAAGLGDHNGAVAEIRKALTLAPADRGLLTATAMAEFQAGELDVAAAHATQAGEDAAAKAVLGDVERQRRNLARASAAYRAAVRLAPDREDFRVTLAFHLTGVQDFRAALSELDAALKRFPQSSRLRMLEGIALYAEGEKERARVSLLAAIESDPAHAEPAYRCLARIALETAAAPPAPVVARLCGWNQTVCAAMRLRVAREQGDNAALESAIAELRAASPDSVVAHCELARALEWAARFEDARVEMETCVTLDPSSPQSHYRLGLLYKRLGLDALSTEQMQLRARLLEKMSEATAAGLDALRSFR